MKQRKNLKIILVIIGIILIFSVINSIYNNYTVDKDYEAKGYETAKATCIKENWYIKNTAR